MKQGLNGDGQTLEVFPRTGTSATAGSTSRTVSNEKPGTFAWLVIIVFAGYWTLLFNQLRVDWSINPQYYYGWVVPFLALSLFHLRWASRPALAPSTHGTVVGIVCALTLFALLPIRLAEEANPEWRLAMWVHAIQMVLITLGALYLAGGWPWVKHFAFPVGFLLLAVPWPVPLEQGIIQGLMRGIAGATVETADFLGIPAVQHGNLIEISKGVVGIDEACSGVRSIQTTLFISLFLGELYRLSVGRRFALTLSSLLLALCANLGRTTFLVWTAAHDGLDRMHQLHDTAGMTALVATLLGAWALAQAFRWKLQPQAAAALSSQPTGRSLPRVAIYAMAGWIIVAEGTTQLWYRMHESGNLENARWSIAMPTGENSFAELPVSESVRSMLRYSNGQAAAWQDKAGNRWQAFLFRWEPGRNSAQLATAHTPDICLQAAGYKLVKDLGVRPVEVKDLALPVRQSVFSARNEPLHVFYCLWEDRPVKDSTGISSGELSLNGRLEAIRNGRRHLGQQVLEITVQGPDTAEAAAAIFNGTIGNLVVRK